MNEGRVVCSSNLFASFPRRQALELIRDLGFRYVDLWASPPICHHVDLLDDDPDTVRRDLDDFGMSAASLTVFLTTEEERSRSLDLAAGIGARYVVIEPAPSASWPAVMPDLTNPARLLAPPGGSIADFTAQMVSYAEEAAAMGMVACVEAPHVATVISNRDEIAMFLTDARSNPFALTLAPPHLAVAGDSLLDCVEEFADRTEMFYLWNVRPDYQVGVDGRTYGTGRQQLDPDGALPVEESARWLYESGWRRDFVIAAHGTEANTDGEAVSQMVARATRQLPAPLQESLQTR